MAGPPVTNHEREHMRQMRAQKLPLEEIAARLGRTGKCVHDHVHDLGIRCRPGTKGLTAEGYARLLAAAESGVPHTELSARFGLAVSSVAPTVSRLRRARRLAASTREAQAC